MARHRPGAGAPQIADDAGVTNELLRIGRELKKLPNRSVVIYATGRKPANKTQHTNLSRDAGSRLNQRIRVPEVRVVDAEGNALGVMSTRDALALAQERGLDLVEVAPMARPPVCRILDYGKCRYEQAKRRRQAGRKERRAEVKRLQISYGAEVYHLGFRVRDAARILSEGYRLLVTLHFKGAERKYPEVGRAQMERLAEGVSDVGVVERPPTLEGRRLTMLLAPK